MIVRKSRKEQFCAYRPHFDAFRIGKVTGYLRGRVCNSDSSNTAGVTSPIPTPTGTPLGSSPPEVNDQLETSDPSALYLFSGSTP